MQVQKFVPKNIFSTLAYLATERQLEYQNSVYPLGKLECYIFFSTYISLQTSYLNLVNSDNVDLYLMEGLESYVEYLKIDTEYEAGLSANEYIKRRAGKLVKDIVNLQKVEMFEEEVTILKFIRHFQSEDPSNDIEIEEEKVNEIRVFNAILVDNLEIIDSLYEKQKENLSMLKLATWEKNCGDFLKNSSQLVESLAVMPFEEPRCNICGSFELRENLKNTFIDDSDMGMTLLLPVCDDCRKKHIAEDGFIHY